MGQKFYDESDIQNIANAIRSKNGTQNTYTVAQMAGAVGNIPTGITPSGSVTLTSNGTYDVTDKASAVVAVPTNLIPKTITENGVYNAISDNADGYDVVTVDIPEKNTFDEYFAKTLEVANIPSAITIISQQFVGSTNLKSVIMPNVQRIYNSAFQDCIKLIMTSLPASVVEIQANAFRRCTSIPYLDFSDFVQIPTLGSHAFRDTTFPFYFRDQQQLDEWAAATNWSTYASRFQIKPSGVI